MRQSGLPRPKGRPKKGDRVEIAPYRNGRFFHSYAAFDGSRGVLDCVSGAKAWVDVESEAEHRAGCRAFPVEVLKALDAQA